MSQLLKSIIAGERQPVISRTRDFGKSAIVDGVYKRASTSEPLVLSACSYASYQIWLVGSGMKNSLGLPVFCFALAAILVLSMPGYAGSQNPDEDAALTLLERTLKHDDVYANRISINCLTYQTEEATAAYFEFVLREMQNAKCGGDPDTNPVVDRYRVYRKSGTIEWLDRVEDKWQRYNSAKIKSG